MDKVNKVVYEEFATKEQINDLVNEVKRLQDKVNMLNKRWSERLQFELYWLNKKIEKRMIKCEINDKAIIELKRRNHNTENETDCNQRN